MGSNKLHKRHRMVWVILSCMMIVSLALSGCGRAEAPKVYKVGVLLGLEFIAPIGDGFKAGMADLGYIEGENIVYDMHVTGFDMAGDKTILQKFVDDGVDLIVVSPTEATIEAKSITQGTDIPVVFSFAFTEGMDIIDSVREPGGNITGVRFPGIDITLKRYQIMRELVPDAKRYWMPFQAGYPIVPPQLEALETLAEADGITLIEFPAENVEALQKELDARAATDDPGMDAIFALVEPLMVTPDAFAVSVKFAYEHNIPLGGVYSSINDQASIYGVNVDLFESGRLAAPLADKIFNGTAAGTIPAVSPENFIQINYKAAREFGLTVPEGLLKQANEIIR